MKQITTYIMEGISRTRVQNMIYKEIQKQRLDGKLYNDEHWQGVKDMKTAIGEILSKNAEGWDFQIYPREGGYRKSKDGMSQWKEYAVEIYDEKEKLQILGTLNCHAAGSVQDPFDRYDMTLVIDKA